MVSFVSGAFMLHLLTDEPHGSTTEFTPGQTARMHRMFEVYREEEGTGSVMGEFESVGG